MKNSELDIRWSGNTIRLDKNKTNPELLCLFKNEPGLIYDDDDDDDLRIKNQENFFIFENAYIKEADAFKHILEKLNRKRYDKYKVFLEAEGKFVEIDQTPADIELYKSIVDKNKIDGGVRQINISIDTLTSILKKNSESYNSKCQVLINFLVMLALANKVEYSNKDCKAIFECEDELFDYSFSLDDEGSEDFGKLYSWVFSLREYNNSHFLKVEIIRRVILKFKKLSDLDKIIETSNMLYQNIVRGKAKDYFDQLLKRERDLIELRLSVTNALKTIVFSMVMLVIYVVNQIFSYFKELHGDNTFKYLFLHSDVNIITWLAILFIGQLILLMLFLYQIRVIMCNYQEIESLYKENFIVDEELLKKQKHIFYENNLKYPKLMINLTVIVTGIFVVFKIICYICQN